MKHQVILVTENDELVIGEFTDKSRAESYAEASKDSFDGRVVIAESECIFTIEGGL